MTIKKTHSIGLGLSLLLPVIAAAQTTTLSIEATEIDGNPVAGGSAGHVVASPGNVIEVKFWIRDWSPEGQILRSYQVTLDVGTFTSGPAGSIAPVGYDEHKNTSNADNAYLDEKNPNFIHKDLHIIPVVHASGPEYKWMSVVFDTNTGPVSKQDGTKKSCGTVRLKVSDDARGEFKISVIKDPEQTMFNDPKNNRVKPLNIEPLIIIVPEAGKWARIGSSIPPSGTIDARITPTGSNSQWSAITLISTGDASSLSPSDFKVTDGTENPPVIKDMKVKDSNVMLQLDRGIQAGHWTVVTHMPSGSTVRLGYLPGDVNNDGSSDAADVLSLIESLNGIGDLPISQSDIDANGSADTNDLAALIRILADPASHANRIKN